VVGAAADHGDAPALALLAEVGGTLGRALAGAVNLLGPGAVFIMGEYTTPLWRHLGPSFDAVLRRHLLPCVQDITVEVRTGRDGLVPFSAACVVLAAPLAARRHTR
jgi:predicted NBD/HSP70 family sugar kinase